MSTSTALAFNTLPPTLQRPPLHDGRSDESEMVKLVNQQRSLLNGTYQTVFSFTTPGDGAAHVAWQAQLDDADAWFIRAVIVATSVAGQVAYWRRDSSVTRNGATVTIQSDVSLSAFATGGVAAFNVGWAVSSLYAQLKLTDSVGTAGTWRVKMEIVRP